MCRTLNITRLFQLFLICSAGKLEKVVMQRCQGKHAKRGVNNTQLLWDGPRCCLVTNILGREPGKHVPPPQETRHSRDCCRGSSCTNTRETKTERELGKQNIRPSPALWNLYRNTMARVNQKRETEKKQGKQYGSEVVPKQETEFYFLHKAK